MIRRTALVMVVLAVVMCAEKKKPVSDAAATLYVVNGRIVDRDAGDNTVRLDHETIPGFMTAMTMDFSVRGAKVADLPPDGSAVTAKLHVTDDAFWLTDVKVR